MKSIPYIFRHDVLNLKVNSWVCKCTTKIIILISTVRRRRWVKVEGLDERAHKLSFP
jgi:hypothetical protein